MVVKLKQLNGLDWSPNLCAAINAELASVALGKKMKCINLRCDPEACATHDKFCFGFSASEFWTLNLH